MDTATYVLERMGCILSFLWQLLLVRLRLRRRGRRLSAMHPVEAHGRLDANTLYMSWCRVQFLKGNAVTARKGNELDT